MPSRNVRARLGLERLEAREVPAGNVNATLANGLLTIVGDDDSNLIVLLRVTPTGVVIEPDVTTTINKIVPSAALTLDGTVSALRVNLKGGEDQITFDNDLDLVIPRGVRFDLGAGNDQLKLDTTGQVRLGNLVVVGAAGDDTITIRGGAGKESEITGPALLHGGPGKNNITVENFKLQGTPGLVVFGGIDDDTVTVKSVQVKRGAIIALGSGTTDSLTVKSSEVGVLTAASSTKLTGALESTTVAGSVLIRAADVDFNFDSVQVGGTLFVTSFGLDKTLAVGIEGDTQMDRFVARSIGSASIEQGFAVWNVERDIFISSLRGSAELVMIHPTTMTADSMRIQGLTGAQLATQDIGGNDHSATVTFLGDCQIKSPLGEAVVNLDNTVLLARNLTLDGVRADYLHIEISRNGSVSPSQLSLTGNFNVKARSDLASIFVSMSDGNVDGTVTVTSISSTAELRANSFPNDPFAIGGEVRVIGKTSAALQLNVKCALAENVLVRGGIGQSSFFAGPNARFRKNVTFESSKGDSSLSITGTTGITNIDGNLTIKTGPGANTINLDAVKIAGITQIITGSGDDILTIANGSTFTGAFSADLGDGKDAIFISAAGGQTGPTTFVGVATILAGGDDDSLLLGNTAGDLFNTAKFNSEGNRIDGGTGLNSFDDEKSQTVGIDLATETFNWTDPTP